MSHLLQLEICRTGVDEIKMGTTKEFSNFCFKMSSTSRPKQKRSDFQPPFADVTNKPKVKLEKKGGTVKVKGRGSDTQPYQKLFMIEWLEVSKQLIVDSGKPQNCEG